MDDNAAKGSKESAAEERRSNPITRLVSRKIIPKQRLQAMAALAAKVQGVGVHQAQATLPVLAAVRELNDIARLATGTLLRRSGPEVMFRQRLSEALPQDFSVGLSGRGRSAGIVL